MRAVRRLQRRSNRIRCVWHHHGSNDGDQDDDEQQGKPNEERGVDPEAPPLGSRRGRRY
jgi:hypothetical protein